MHLITIGTCQCGKRGTLVDGRCGFCDDATNGHLACPKPVAPMTVTRALDLLVAELVADDIPAPLHQRLTLASVAADLCRLAGEPVPVAVLDALDGPAYAPRETHREPAEEDYRAYSEEYRDRADTIRRGLRLDAYAAD